MKGELKNWRIEELKKRVVRRISSIPQFLNSSVLLLLLAACGFQPLYGKQQGAATLADFSAFSITVNSADVSTQTNSVTGRRYAELLKAEIEGQINPKSYRSAPRFQLHIHYEEQQMGLFVNPDGTSSRGDLVYSSDYTVTRLLDQKMVASGSLTRTSSYNTSVNADYASYVSIEDARKRGIIELAQDYKLRLAALLPTLNDVSATAHDAPKQAPPLMAVPVDPSTHPSPALTYETVP